MNAHVCRDHDITIGECEAYSGDDFARPDDSTVERAVETLIKRHAEEFQDLVSEAELVRAHELREIMMEGDR